MRGYFENTLADSITNRKKFRSGLTIHDISKPGRDARDRVPRDAGPRHQPPVVAGRPLRLRVGALRRLHRPHPLHRRSARTSPSPRSSSRWWLPGMNRAARRDADAGPGPARRAASHDHGRQLAAMAPGATAGLTVHDLSDRANPKLLSHINWSPPFPGGTHTRAAVAGPQAGGGGRRGQRGEVRQGHVPHVRRRRARAGEPGADRHAARRRRSATTARAGHVRPAQPAREPAGLLPERGHDLRHLQQRRRARVRHHGPVRAEGNRLLGAARAEED